LVFDSFLQTDFDAYNGEVRAFFNQHIREDGSIPKYIAGELDSAMLPAVMLELLNRGDLTQQERERYAAAADYVYDQLEKQTIYPEAGNLWLHSQKADGSPRPAWVKWNVCLDGLFMSQTFLIRLAEAIDRGNVQITGKDGNPVSSDQLWDDIYSRLTFVMEHMRDPKTGLLFHGYCVETGATNEACWSRGLGWFTMVLMEAAEKMPEGERKDVLNAYFQDLMAAVVEWQDPLTGLWYNVTDGREEYFYQKTVDGVDTFIYNMPESSGSAMFAYCLLRGYHNGLLKDDRFRTAGLWAFNAMVETKLTEEGLTDIYSSSSVTGNKNLYQKNGYVTNDGKGVGPFIMAANYAY
jgi:unsaturated rhamnogalacturonyl hydrolase